MIPFVSFIALLPWDDVRGKVDDLIAGFVGFVSALGPVQNYLFE